MTLKDRPEHRPFPCQWAEEDCGMTRADPHGGGEHPKCRCAGDALGPEEARHDQGDNLRAEAKDVVAKRRNGPLTREKAPPSEIVKLRAGDRGAEGKGESF